MEDTLVLGNVEASNKFNLEFIRKNSKCNWSITAEQVLRSWQLNNIFGKYLNVCLTF